MSKPQPSYTEEDRPFVEDKSYMGGGPSMFSRQKRPLNMIKISNLFTNTETNLLGIMLCTAFAQMAQHADVKSYMMRE